MPLLKSMFKWLHIYTSYDCDLASAQSRVRSVTRDAVGDKTLQDWLYWAVANNRTDAVTYLLNSGVLVGGDYSLLTKAMEYHNFEIAYLLRIHHAKAGMIFRNQIRTDRCDLASMGHTKAVLKEALDFLDCLAHPPDDAWKPVAAYYFQERGSGSALTDNVLTSWPPRGSPQWPPKGCGLPADLHFQMLQYWDAVRKLRRAEARSLVSMNWQRFRGKVKMRCIALYWQEETAKKLYGQGGAGRAAELAVWVEDPFFGSA